MAEPKKPWWMRKKFASLRISIKHVDTREEAHRLIDMIYDMNDDPNLPYEGERVSTPVTVRSPFTGARYEETVTYRVVRGYRNFRLITARATKKRRKLA